MQEKVIALEEQVYESKLIQLDLLDKLQAMEQAIEFAERQVKEILDINQELENESIELKNVAEDYKKKFEEVDEILDSLK